jgi:hypothetical protein
VKCEYEPGGGEVTEVAAVAGDAGEQDVEGLGPGELPRGRRGRGALAVGVVEEAGRGLGLERRGPGAA